MDRRYECRSNLTTWLLTWIQIPEACGVVYLRKLSCPETPYTFRSRAGAILLASCSLLKNVFLESLFVRWSGCCEMMYFFVVVVVFRSRTSRYSKLGSQLFLHVHSLGPRFLCRWSQSCTFRLYNREQRVGLRDSIGWFKNEKGPSVGGY